MSPFWSPTGLSPIVPWLLPLGESFHHRGSGDPEPSSQARIITDRKGGGRRWRGNTRIKVVGELWILFFLFFLVFVFCLFLVFCFGLRFLLIVLSLSPLFDLCTSLLRTSCAYSLFLIDYSTYMISGRNRLLGLAEISWESQGSPLA